MLAQYWEEYLSQSTFYSVLGQYRDKIYTQGPKGVPIIQCCPNIVPKNLCYLGCQHNYNTRNRNLLVPVYHRLTLTQHSISKRGPDVWNNIPDHIKNLNSFPLFKKYLKEFLISSYSSEQA